MVHNGLVMESAKDYIIVLTDDANYIKLKNKGDINVGKKIMFIEEDIIKEKNKYVRPFIGVVAAVIMLMTIIIGQFGINLIDSSTAYAIVSLDINPSLEFQIDKKEIVRKIKSLNKDGEELIDDNMIGMKIEDAITLSIKKALNKNYLNNKNNIVLVSDVIMDGNPQDPDVIEKKIFRKVEEDKELKNIDVIYVVSDKEDLEKARENQVSVGKYKVYEIVSKNNPDVKINDIKEKKVSDIVKENKELTNSKKVKTKKKDDKTEKQKKRKKNKEKNQKKKSRKENIKKQKSKLRKIKNKKIEKKKNLKEKTEYEKKRKKKIKDKDNLKRDKKKKNDKTIENNKNKKKDSKKDNTKIKQEDKRIKKEKQKQDNKKNKSSEDKDD